MSHCQRCDSYRAAGGPSKCENCTITDLAAQLAATHAAIRALRDKFSAEEREHLEAADGFRRDCDRSGNIHAELKARRICREHAAAISLLLGETLQQIQRRTGCDVSTAMKIQEIAKEIVNGLNGDPENQEVHPSRIAWVVARLDLARLLGDPAQEQP